VPRIVLNGYTWSLTDDTTGETIQLRIGDGNLTYASHAKDNLTYVNYGEIKVVQEKPKDGDQLLLDFND